MCQASLSRPESPRNLNDDLPSTSRLARPSPGLRSGGSGLGSHYASPAPAPAPAPMSGGGLGPSYASPSPALRRRDSARDSRYRLVSSTGHRAIPATGRGETPGEVTLNIAAVSDYSMQVWRRRRPRCEAPSCSCTRLAGSRARWAGGRCPGWRTFETRSPTTFRNYRPRSTPTSPTPHTLCPGTTGNF